MADSKKYDGSTWQHSLRKLTTSSDTITTLPADLYADGNSATVGLVGNMSQTGTPTPQNPIQPTETGDKTANLCDEDNLNQGYYNNTPPFAFNDDNRYRCFSLNLTAGTYSILVYGSNIPMRLMRISSNSLGIGTVSRDNEPYTFDLMVSETVYISFRNTDTSTDFTGLTVMMNAGNTVLPYEPYGQYKIPILSGGTTTNVYLGEVQSTRRIKKLELTGEEDWERNASSGSRYYFRVSNLVADGIVGQVVCSHYISPEDAISQNNTVEGVRVQDSSNYGRILIVRTPTYTTDTVADFQAFLQQQYANGTPVTVWYVLATPTTGIVNEPLRKIGDYADTVSGITIPTITGKDTFDVLTTLKPSEVELTYTGWHDATVKEWDGSEWQ